MSVGLHLCRLPFPTCKVPAILVEQSGDAEVIFTRFHEPQHPLPMPSPEPAARSQTKETCAQCRTRKASGLALCRLSLPVPSALPLPATTLATKLTISQVRCDGQVPVCGHCGRLKFDCSFQRSSSDEPSASTPERAAKPDRLRASQACLECRQQKSRCSGELPSCSNCRRRQKNCQYVFPEGVARASSSTPVHHTESSPGSPAESSIEFRLSTLLTAREPQNLYARSIKPFAFLLFRFLQCSFAFLNL